MAISYSLMCFMSVLLATLQIACEQAHLFGWGAATESWLVPKQVSLFAG